MMLFKLRAHRANLMNLFIVWPLSFLLYTLNAECHAQSNAYFEAAKKYREAAVATRCAARREYLIAMAAYTDCIGKQVRGETCTARQPSGPVPPCLEDAGKSVQFEPVSKTSEVGYAALGKDASSMVTLNPFLKEVYKVYNGDYPSANQIGEMDVMRDTGLGVTTMNAVAASAVGLYSALGSFDQESASRLLITSSVGNMVSLVSGANEKQSETLQATAQGIGILWDMVEKSKSKKKAIENEEKKRLALIKAQEEYESSVMKAKAEFIHGFRTKVFEPKYNGKERHALALWHPKKLNIDVQTVYLSNLFSVQPYNDGSFPVRENLGSYIRSEIPAELQNNQDYELVFVYPIATVGEYQQKLLSILKATESVHLKPAVILIADKKEKSASSINYWDEPAKPKQKSNDNFWNQP